VHTDGVDAAPSLADFQAAFRTATGAGVLPDGEVLGSSREDWPAVLAVLEGLGASAIWSDGTAEATASSLLDPMRDGGVLAVWPLPGMRLNFFAGPEVLFDVDLRELVSEEALGRLLDVIAGIGVACAKPVVLSSEGDRNDIVIRYDPLKRMFTVGQSAYR
jgi:hypothetical protein